MAELKLGNSASGNGLTEFCTFIGGELNLHSIMDQEKGYDLVIEERDGYLYAVAGGPKLTAQISSAYWNEIAGRCFASGVDKILIEKNFVVGVGPADMLAMADHLGNLLPGRKIAFVDRFHHDDINELGKKLARNREVMMQLFGSVAEAERWLLAN